MPKMTVCPVCGTSYTGGLPEHAGICPNHQNHPRSVSTMTGRQADARTTRNQITPGVLMSCGARDFVSDNANGLLMFRVGSGRVLRKVLVRLLPHDLYAVEVGRMDRRTFEWIVEDQRFDVPAESLARAVLELGDR